MTPRNSHRGFALLLALAALSVVGTLGAGALIRAQDAVSTVQFSLADVQSRLALDSAEGILVQWIADSDSSFASMQWPADGFAGVLKSGNGELSITVDAIDLSGRLHAARLESFAMRGLPSKLQSIDALEARRLVESLRHEELAPTLEQIAAMRSTFSPDAFIRVFPLEASTLNEPALCQWLTTQGSGALNLHSAPPALLRAALHGLNPTQARRAVAARQSGERVEDAVASALIAERNRTSARSGRASRHIPLTTTSSAIGFLIRVEQAGRVERWWLAAEPTPNQEAAQPAAWRVMERRRIDL